MATYSIASAHEPIHGTVQTTENYLAFADDAHEPPQALKQLAVDTDKIPSDLQCFFLSDTIEAMKTTIIRNGRCWVTLQALPDLYDHIQAVSNEFKGQPEINFYHAALIIKIRRQADLDESLQAFHSLWNAEGIALIQLLTGRWIISALDTFADHGKVGERAAAMSIVAFANTLKMADTEYSLTGQPAYDAARLNENRDTCPELWNGVRAFQLPEDDTFANMIRRMRKTLAPTPMFALMFESLLYNAVCKESLITRLARHHARRLL